MPRIDLVLACFMGLLLFVNLARADIRLNLDDAPADEAWQNWCDVQDEHRDLAIYSLCEQNSPKPVFKDPFSQFLLDQVKLNSWHLVEALQLGKVFQSICWKPLSLDPKATFSSVSSASSAKAQVPSALSQARRFTVELDMGLDRTLLQFRYTPFAKP